MTSTSLVTTWYCSGIIVAFNVRNAMHAKSPFKVGKIDWRHITHIQVRKSKNFECNLLSLTSPILSPPVLKLHSTFLISWILLSFQTSLMVCSSPPFSWRILQPFYYSVAPLPVGSLSRRTLRKVWILMLWYGMTLLLPSYSDMDDPPSYGYS